MFNWTKGKTTSSLIWSHYKQRCTECKNSSENVDWWLLYIQHKSQSVRCCTTQPPRSEDLIHILIICTAYSDIRKRMIPEYQNLCLKTRIPLDFEAISSQDQKLCQFLLDPSSFNLKVRVGLSVPILGDFFKLSRDYCNAINMKRMKILRAEENTQWMK